MEIENVINRAVVIDNKEDEGNAIAEALKNADVHTDFIIVHEDESANDFKTFYHPRELIIADLLLDEDKTKLKTNISRLIGIINKIQPENAKFYGIIVWTKHKEFAKDFQEKIGNAVALVENRVDDSEDEEEILTPSYLQNPPLFVFTLDKTRYFNDGKYVFEGLLKDINSKLKESRTAYFSLKWKQSINESIENVINDIYQISTDYNKHEEVLSYILKALSKNETGEKGDENLTIGAYKAFDCLLQSELASIIRKETLPNLMDIGENPYQNSIEKLQEISAKLNTSLFLDSHNLNKNEILPGNVYRILDEESPLIVPKDELIKKPIKKEGTNTYEQRNNYNRINIAIELTPPCDFTNKKIYSRFVGGYIFDYPLGYIKKEKTFSPQKAEKRFIIYPIFVPEDENAKCIVFDFRCLWTLTDEVIKNEDKYNLWFAAKPRLFADILQKFSSHAARLGINDIHLE